MSDDELHTVVCIECNWESHAYDEVDALMSGFYHVIGQGHDLREKDHERIENAFDL